VRLGAFLIGRGLSMESLPVHAVDNQKLCGFQNSNNNLTC
jgi:hypothetical protein